jgi:polyhydroxybutyrate depolymerase
MKYSLVSLLVLFSLAAYSQLTTDSVLIEGHYRSFHFNKPAKDINGGSLMFIMHGSGGSAKNIMKATTKLEAIASNQNLLIVYPDGYKNYWNECRKYATSVANKENINENAFFKVMISYFNNRYGINKKEIFAAGFSGGGHMAYKLGLTMPGDIKAIAAIVANMPDSASSDCAASGKPLPVLIINGTLDNVNPYNGGEMFVNNSSYGVVRSSDNTFAFWSRLAGYKGEAEKILLPDNDPGDNKTIESYTYKAKDKPQVSLLKVIGGKHDYPGDIDVYVYAWDFFKVQNKGLSISTPDRGKKIQLVDAACGQCQLGLPGKSCDLAVRINGKAYFVDGTDIDSHGDAHAKDGFCEAIRKAEVQGEVKDGRFVATYFRLISQPSGEKNLK